MEFKGKIIAILPKREGLAKSTGNPWCVQEYVIENHDQYPKKVCFEVFGQDKIDQFQIQIGQELNVSFDIDARQWNDRWFNSIRVWRVQSCAVTAAAPQRIPVQQKQFQPQQEYIPIPVEGDDGDLPF